MSDEPSAKKAKVKKHTVPYVIAYDIEATGMSQVRHWMPEFAASLWKVGEKQPEETFYRCMWQPPTTGWCPKTARQFWDKKEKGKDGKTPRELMLARAATTTVYDPRVAMADFVRWVRAIETRLAAQGDTVLLISDTAGFDAGMMNHYLATYCPDLCENMCDITGSYRPIRDISAFYFGIGKSLQKHGSVENALHGFELTQLPDWVKVYEHNHDPLSDANSIGAVASFVLSLCD